MVSNIYIRLCLPSLRLQLLHSFLLVFLYFSNNKEEKNAVPLLSGEVKGAVRLLSHTFGAWEEKAAKGLPFAVQNKRASTGVMFDIWQGPLYANICRYIRERLHTWVVLRKRREE